MFAYQAILKTLQFMEVGNTPQGHTLLGDIVYNGLATFFILCALAIGSTVPLLIHSLGHRAKLNEGYENQTRVRILSSRHQNNITFAV